MEAKAYVLYRIQNLDKEKQIQGLCRKLEMGTRTLRPADVDREIGVLAGIQRLRTGNAPAGHQNAPVGYELPELMIFSGLGDGMLEQFLSEYKRAGIEPVSLKAIVTQYNLSWTVYELAEELIRERTAMLLGRK